MLFSIFQFYLLFLNYISLSPTPNMKTICSHGFKSGGNIRAPSVILVLDVDLEI